MSSKNSKNIKCVVWDLDNTLWDGVILENDNVVLRENVVDIIKELDNRGILQSIASKNEAQKAMSKLEEFGLKDFFLYPQINWNPKSSSIETIAKSINININTLVFVDDQQFELDEVRFSHPEVLCIDAADINKIPDMPEMQPRFITNDSKNRRQLYLTDIKRNTVEETFQGPKEDFLASLNMVLTIEQAKENDLKRAEELTVRTHQLNTTGYTYSYDDLDYFRNSSDYLLYVATLDDKYGTYGKIGLALIETTKDIWRIKLLLMSCRVMSRGVGGSVINYLRNKARENNVRLLAEFLPTDVNRMMYMTYSFTNFKETDKKDKLIILENDLSIVQQYPNYLKIRH